VKAADPSLEGGETFTDVKNVVTTEQAKGIIESIEKEKTKV